ncbi:DUF3048 domain-containing protein [Nocardioides alcanivorans]|uniref:DUF3048 domain-containing protein n=1 Tax=Nocardioides alcanivorans TaxID=2897352 RepID=UPI001F398BA0|nr:DUF3048 domain-containing protein [Nocardioides alcanivorans]
MRAFRPTIAAVALASLVLAGCGGGDDSGGGDGEKSNPKGQGDEQVLASTWPLTGLEVKKGDSSTLDHPVLVAKIDNTSNSAPQIGLSKADLVVEELVEGGLTRLAVFYYSELPEVAGPIRSMRASDIGIVKPVNGEMVTSGAAGQTIARLNNAGVKFHQEGTAGLYRDSSRSGVYSVMANLKEIAANTKAGGDRPKDYLPWGEADDLPKGQPATSISASFGSHTTTWAFEDGHYVNKNTYAAADDQFLADSVLVLEVEIGDAGYLDPGNNPVPETKLEGKGPATLFHDGRAIRGTFVKKGLSGVITLKTKNGQLKVPAGNTWVELVPNDRGGVTFD